jgi:hypothetical protein
MGYPYRFFVYVRWSDTDYNMVIDRAVTSQEADELVSDYLKVETIPDTRYWWEPISETTLKLLEERHQRLGN